MAAFIKNIQNTADRYALWKRGSKIVVGVSGGPDSVCLLDVLVFLSKKYDWKLRIAHINYGLRGEESDQDAKLVADLAKHYKIPCSTLAPKVHGNENIEERLRDIRYHFFETVRKENDFDLIAVAHTQDDQAETLLMRLIRGSGLSGLRAMRPKNGRIIRPLLETSRSEVLGYTESKSLRYRIDASNTDERFFRNKVRHQLIPYLKENFNPSIKEVLARTAIGIAEDYDILSSLMHPFPLDFHQKNDKSITFQSEDFLKLHLGIQKTVLRHFFGLILGDTKGFTKSHTDEAIKMIRSRKSKIKTLAFNGLNLVQKGATVSILPTIR